MMYEQLNVVREVIMSAYELQDLQTIELRKW